MSEQVEEPKEPTTETEEGGESTGTTEEGDGAETSA